MHGVREWGFRAKLFDDEGETDVDERGAEEVEEQLREPELFSLEANDDAVLKLVAGGYGELPDGADEEREAD